MEKTPSFLTNDERFLIEQIVARFAVLYAHTVARYKTPQGLAKALPKMLLSKKLLTMEALLCGTVNEHITKVIFFPQDFSEQQLLQVNYIPGVYEYWKEGRLQKVKFAISLRDIKLRPKELTHILKIMTSLGIYFNIKGLKKIKELNSCSPDNRTINRNQIKTMHIRGGYPSAYTFTPAFHELVALIKKPDAMALFKDILVATNLAFNFENFMLRAFFYLCKIDKDQALSFIEIFWPEILRQKNKVNPKELVERISMSSEKDLETNSLELAKTIVMNRSYDWFFLIGSRVPI